MEMRNGITKTASIYPSNFTGRQGTTKIPTSCRSPAQFLSLLFTDAILEQFVTETNSYGKNNPSTYMLNENNAVTLQEMKKFFAFVLYMGLVQLPSRDMFWQHDIFGSSFVKRCFTRRRFYTISTNLHWRDVSNIPDTEKAQRNKVDGFWSVDDFFEALADNFMAYYTCGQLINIDEMCIFFKGRHKCKCYNPSKPNKWHLKALCLNDSETGYLFNFFTYRGCDEERPPGMPATVWPVVKLTEPSVLHGLGHVVATDNWYTSLGTVAELSKEPKRMHTIGTVRTNKKGLPKQGIFPAKGKQVKKQGEFACHKLANKEVYFVSWMDNKPVHLLMTWEPYSSSVGRVEKGKKDGYVRKTIPIPTAVQAYNASMGGTDKFDQFSSYYDDRLRTVSWKHRLFAHFFRAACINAHILFNIKTGQKLSLLKFIQGVGRMGWRRIPSNV